MADPPISRNASPTFSNSPPPEYLNEADLLEFPLIRATNLYTDEGYEHQSDTTDDEESSSFGQSIRADDNDLAPQLKCTICQKRQKLEQTVALRCKCVYCKGCLERRFTRAIEAEYMFPATCCDAVIDLALVHQVLSPDILRGYETKKIEFESTDRTYCANRDCFAFIAQETIEGDKAVCANSTCHTTTCVKCKGEWHKGDCPVDEALQLVLVEAEKKGWKRCAKCGVLIEHIDGCAHITCQCGHQFCYCCRAVWKTCLCGPEELDQTLGVTDRYLNNEYLIQNNEGNNNYNEYIPLHFNRRPQYRGRCNRRVDTTHFRRQLEVRTRPTRNQHMGNSASNASPLTVGEAAQYQAPDPNRARHFTENCGPPPSINENSNTFMNTQASPTPRSSARESHDRTHAGFAPPAEESVQYSSASNNPPGILRFFGRFAQDYDSDPNRVRQLGRPRGTQATANNEHSRHASLNAQNSLSIDFNYNEDDDNKSYTSTPITAAEPLSDIGFANEAGLRPFEEQFTAPTHNSSVITADEQAPVQHNNPDA